MQDLGMRELLEHLAGDAARRAAAAVAELAGLLLGLRQQLGNGPVRRVGAHHQHLAALAEAGDRNEILHRVVGQLPVEMLVGGMRGVGRDQHRVAVGRSAGHGLRAEHAAGAGLVVDHHRLLGLLGDRRAERARQLVGGAAGGERHDEGQRPRRIRLAEGGGGGEQGGSGGGERSQRLAARRVRMHREGLHRVGSDRAVAAARARQACRAAARPASCRACRGRTDRRRRRARSS